MLNYTKLKSITITSNELLKINNKILTYTEERITIHSQDLTTEKERDIIDILNKETTAQENIKIKILKIKNNNIFILLENNSFLILTEDIEVKENIDLNTIEEEYKLTNYILSLPNNKEEEIIITNFTIFNNIILFLKNNRIYYNNKYYNANDINSTDNYIILIDDKLSLLNDKETIEYNYNYYNYTENIIVIIKDNNLMIIDRNIDNILEYDISHLDINDVSLIVSEDKGKLIINIGEEFLMYNKKIEEIDSIYLRMNNRRVVLLKSILLLEDNVYLLDKDNIFMRYQEEIEDDFELEDIEEDKLKDNTNNLLIIEDSKTAVDNLLDDKNSIDNINDILRIEEESMVKEEVNDVFSNNIIKDSYNNIKDSMFNKSIINNKSTDTMKSKSEDTKNPFDSMIKNNKEDIKNPFSVFAKDNIKNNKEDNKEVEDKSEDKKNPFSVFAKDNIKNNKEDNKEVEDKSEDKKNPFDSIMKGQQSVDNSQTSFSSIIKDNTAGKKDPFSIFNKDNIKDNKEIEEQVKEKDNPFTFIKKDNIKDTSSPFSLKEIKPKEVGDKSPFNIFTQEAKNPFNIPGKDSKSPFILENNTKDKKEYKNFNPSEQEKTKEEYKNLIKNKILKEMEEIRKEFNNIKIEEHPIKLFRYNERGIITHTHIKERLDKMIAMEKDKSIKNKYSKDTIIKDDINRLRNKLELLKVEEVKGVEYFDSYIRKEVKIEPLRYRGNRPRNNPGIISKNTIKDNNVIQENKKDIIEDNKINKDNNMLNENNTTKDVIKDNNNLNNAIQNNPFKNTVTGNIQAGTFNNTILGEETHNPFTNVINYTASTTNNTFNTPNNTNNPTFSFSVNNKKKNISDILKEYKQRE